MSNIHNTYSYFADRSDCAAYWLLVPSPWDGLPIVGRLQ